MAAKGRNRLYSDQLPSYDIPMYITTKSNIATLVVNKYGFIYIVIYDLNNIFNVAFIEYGDTERGFLEAVEDLQKLDEIGRVVYKEYRLPISKICPNHKFREYYKRSGVAQAVRDSERKIEELKAIVEDIVTNDLRRVDSAVVVYTNEYMPDKFFELVLCRPVYGPEIVECRLKPTPEAFNRFPQTAIMTELRKYPVISCEKTIEETAKILFMYGMYNADEIYVEPLDSGL